MSFLEFLYGCGLRVSELVGLNLDDVDRAERWLRVRGKGRKERQVPFGGKAADALERYLEVRGSPEPAVFLNHRGGRLTDRGVRGRWAGSFGHRGGTEWMSPRYTPRPCSGSTTASGQSSRRTRGPFMPATDLGSRPCTG